MKNSKIKLSEIKIDSFVTTVDDQDLVGVKGGGVTVIIIIHSAQRCPTPYKWVETDNEPWCRGTTPTATDDY